MDLELTLTTLEGKRAVANQKSSSLIARSHLLFQRAEQEKNSLKRWWYTTQAVFIQSRAIDYSLEASQYFDKYWNLRRQAKADIDHTANALGYSARLQSI